MRAHGLPSRVASTVWISSSGSVTGPATYQ
jgi:hypothetical protein